MTTRRLEVVEMDTAAAVHRAAFDDRLPWLVGLHTPEEDRSYFRGQLYRICQIWGAFEDATLIGIIAFRDDWIDQLYILPRAQRHGIGTALLEIAKSAFPRLHLWTFQRNIAARNFYEARSFVKVRETDGENDEKEPDILYRWTCA
jgi:putative acetyltransferase